MNDIPKNNVILFQCEEMVWHIFYFILSIKLKYLENLERRKVVIEKRF